MKSLVIVLLLALGTASGREYCQEPHDVGPCRGRFMRFYYEPSLGYCLKFHFGGCRGNRNNFESSEDCMRTCSASSTEVPTTTAATVTVATVAAERDEVAVGVSGGNVTGWGPWRKWGRCYPALSRVAAPACGPGSGRQKRRRRCNSNGFCKGLRYQEQQCTLVKCEPVYQFGGWSECSSSCGTGIQTRTRTCSAAESSAVVCGGPSLESRQCKVRSCRNGKVKHVCDRSPCQHGSQCVKVQQYFRCLCGPNFSGPLCQHSLLPTGWGETTSPAAVSSGVPTTEAPREVPTTTGTPEVHPQCPAVRGVVERQGMTMVCTRGQSPLLDRARSTGRVVFPTPCMAKAFKPANQKAGWKCLWMILSLPEFEQYHRSRWCGNGTSHEPAQVNELSVVMSPVPSRLPARCTRQRVLYPLPAYGEFTSDTRLRAKPTLPRMPRCMGEDAVGVVYGRRGKVGANQTVVIVPDEYVVLPHRHSTARDVVAFLLC